VQDVSVDGDDDVFVRYCNLVVLGYVLNRHWWEQLETYGIGK